MISDDLHSLANAGTAQIGQQIGNGIVRRQLWVVRIGAPELNGDNTRILWRSQGTGTAPDIGAQLDHWPAALFRRLSK